MLRTRSGWKQSSRSGNSGLRLPLLMLLALLIIANIAYHHFLLLFKVFSVMNSTYTVLARKYRPSTITELKGQEVLVQTLQNSFKSKRIAHAFLLSGARGIGKTSTARILAKALNCTGADGQGQETLTPCGVCDNCISIGKDSSLDVTEMDAASNTSIDDIREVIESVKYHPVNSRYKVYIIDEVHMLSKSAFNALLKTLEEPPAFAKFIFATTEIKKVPITIISRCQHFSLRRLNIQQLEEHLADICKKENVTFEPRALTLIAQAGDGSVRDSLSILDQAINIASGNLTEQSLEHMLNKDNTIHTFELFKALCIGDDKGALTLLSEVYNRGLELTALIEELLELCHLITMYKVMGDSVSNLGHLLTSDQIVKYQALSNALTLNGLMVLWQLLVKGLEEVSLSVEQRRATEMLFLRITWLNTDIFSTEVLRKYLATSYRPMGNKDAPSIPAAVASSDAREENFNAAPPPLQEVALPNKAEPNPATDVTDHDLKMLFPGAAVVD